MQLDVYFWPEMTLKGQTEVTFLFLRHWASEGIIYSGSLSLLPFVHLFSRSCDHNNSVITEANSSILIPVIDCMKDLPSSKMGDLDIFQGHRLIKGSVCHHDISTPTICITLILIPVIHIMKLKVKFKDG